METRMRTVREETDMKEGGGVGGGDLGRGDLEDPREWREN